MNTTDTPDLKRTAMAAVHYCADTMEAQAEQLMRLLPTVGIEAGSRARTRSLVEGLKDTAGRVIFELALLQTEHSDDNVAAATAVQRLSSMDAAMMEALGRIADIADELEIAAECDDTREPAYVLVIESMGVMMQALERARAATQALSAGMPTAARL